jgi:hypothetical protein
MKQTEYVILHAPNDGYYSIFVATSNKHFFFVDGGWTEVFAGDWEECLDHMCALEECERGDLINLYCHDTFSQIQTTEECLNEILELEPDFLENKIFMPL